MRKHTYHDERGNQVLLGSRCLGVGGEGAVYPIEGTSDWVAKIYSHPVPQEKVAKLSGMARSPTPALLKFAAWPTRTLYDPKSGVARGFVMPRIKDVRAIHELYGPTSRKLHFPRAEWQFLIRAARNCAAAFSTLHDRGIVVGDVNQGNVLVSSNALVTLIDCDSFQFRENGSIYRCPVGVPEFTPPELQGVGDFKNVDRTTDHDGFGLAVLIFHLLFMGRHPFAGRFLGKGDMPIERAIREDRFAYSRSAARRQMTAPPHTISLGDLSGEVALLFERAFGSTKRPSAREWAMALEGIENRLSKCRQDPGHLYLQSLTSCPWCRVASNGGPNFFISVSIAALAGKDGIVDLASIWAEIQRLPLPSLLISLELESTKSRSVRPNPLPNELLLPLPQPPHADDGPANAELAARARELAADEGDLERKVTSLRRESVATVEQASRECTKRAAVATRDFEQRHAGLIAAIERRARRTEDRIRYAIRCAIIGACLGVVLMLGGEAAKALPAFLSGIILCVVSGFLWFGLRMRLEDSTATRRRRPVCPEANAIRDEFRRWQRMKEEDLARDLAPFEQRRNRIASELARVREALNREAAARRASRARRLEEHRGIYLKRERLIQVVHDERATALHHAEEHLRTECDRLRATVEAADNRFRKRLESLANVWQKSQELDRLKGAEFQKLQENARKMQLEEHLKRSFIRDADISLIGSGRIATLQSYGIETAFDLSGLNSGSVPGFGEVLMRNLMAWRKRQEGQFRFDASKGVPHDARLAIEVRYHQLKTQCATALKEGASAMRQIGKKSRVETEEIRLAFARRQGDASQALADLATADKALVTIRSAIQVLSE